MHGNSFRPSRLNDGRKIPGIGFGTWKIPQETCVDNVDLAIELGFNHIDTAQIYGNEEQVGKAIKDSGLKRDDLWITTKWSGRPWGDGGSINPKDSMAQSLNKLNLKAVDLYLVHTPRLVSGRIREGWNEIIELHKQGYARSIGVSNYTLDDMKELLEGGEKAPEVIPVVNQIELHPYVWNEYRANVEYCQSKGVAIEAYSPLKPLTTYPGGPVDKPVNAIAKRLGVKPEQVLLAWVVSKGAIALTTSTRKERLQAYLDAGDIKLTEDDTRAIELAGAKGPPSQFMSARFWTRMLTGVAAQLGAYALLKMLVEGK
ncbi:Aldo/keto reductase [Cystobasidium minutum MCA 4210]|uniref:Aldo/keto reductase n=1 Tax=Cystobasidium minutum MCA 4210 TaxID=1397322 RepID=UPI0034CFAB23|eukprot:jgi/Rhomi1/2412/CE2411_5209